MASQSKIPTPERLVNLALTLDRSRKPLSAEEIKLDPSIGYDATANDEAYKKMLQRDRELLAKLGLIIVVSDTYEYSLDTSSTFATSVDLEPSEIAMLRVIAGTLVDDPHFSLANDLRFALNKLERLISKESLPKRFNPRAPRRQLANSNAQSVPGQIECINDAIEDRRYLTFLYRTASGVASSRKVIAHGTYVRLDQHYLVAYDLAREDMRVFRIDRMDDAKLGGDVSPDHLVEPVDIASYIGLPFQYGEEDRFFITFGIAAQDAWRAKRITRGLGELVKLDDASLTWTIDARNTAAACRWAAAQDIQLTPLAPEALVSTWNDLCASALDQQRLRASTTQEATHGKA